MAEGSTTNAGKGGKRSWRGKKVEDDKQERCNLEVGNSIKKVTFAKENGKEYIDFIDFEEMVEEVRKDVLREIREWKGRG